MTIWAVICWGLFIVVLSWCLWACTLCYLFFWSEIKKGFKDWWGLKR